MVVASPTDCQADHGSAKIVSDRMERIIRFWLPVLVWAAVIFALSTSALQGGFTHRLVRSLLQFFFSDVSSATIALVHGIVRKAAHLAEYFLLSFLLWRALRQDDPAAWKKSWAASALFLSLLLAGADEWLQTTQLGRTGSILDVGFDVSGAALAQLWLWWRHRP